MNSSLGHFLATLQRRKQLPSQNKSRPKSTTTYASEEKETFNFPELSKEEFEAFKKTLKAKKRKEQFIYITASIVVILSIYLFVRYLFF